jgi:hypothetical protein
VLYGHAGKAPTKASTKIISNIVDIGQVAPFVLSSITRPFIARAINARPDETAAKHHITEIPPVQYIGPRKTSAQFAVDDDARLLCQKSCHTFALWVLLRGRLRNNFEMKIRQRKSFSV